MTRQIELAALLDVVCQKLAAGRLGDVDDIVIFARGERSAFILVDGTHDIDARAKQLLEDALAWINTNELPRRDDHGPTTERIPP